MADLQTPPNDPKGDQDNGKGNPTGNQEAGNGKNGGNDSAQVIADLKKENENLRGTQKALTEKIDKLTSGLKTVFSGDLPEDGKQDPLKLIEGLNQQIAELKGENAKARARNMVNNVIDNLLDAEGNPVSDEVKTYLKNDIDITDPDEEKIKEVVSKKATSLTEIFKKSGRFTSDNRPAPKGNVGYSDRPKSANEILEKLKPKA